MAIHPQDFDNEDNRSFIPQGFESTSATEHVDSSEPRIGGQASTSSRTEPSTAVASKNATADRDRRGGSTSRPSRSWSSMVLIAGVLVSLFVVGVLLMRVYRISPTPKPEAPPLPSVDNAHHPPSAPIQPGQVPSSGSGTGQTPQKGIQPSKPARKAKPGEEEGGHPLGNGKRDGDNPKW